MEKTSEIYKDFLNWCEDKWTQEHRMQKLLSKVSNDDIAFLKDQYEARLKADMVAMLTDIQLEIEELDTYDIERTHGLIEDSYATTDVSDIIQQKIDALKVREHD